MMRTLMLLVNLATNRQRTVLSLKVGDKTLKLLLKLHSPLQIQEIRFNLMLLVQIAAEYFEQTEHKVLN